MDTNMNLENETAEWPEFDPETCPHEDTYREQWDGWTYHIVCADCCKTLSEHTVPN